MKHLDFILRRGRALCLFWLMLLTAPLAVSAQETLTIYPDATGTNYYVPMNQFTPNRDSVSDFPWTENFESYTSSTYIGSSGVTFSDPDWVNEHISGNGSYLFQVCNRTNGNNSSHQLGLPDMSSGTYTKLALPIMQFEAGRNYQFSLDVYRTSNYSSYTTEGISIFASTDGEIMGSTQLGFIPRVYSAQSNLGTTPIPAETTANSWYTYRFSIPSGTTRIILRGESKYGAATFMDNFKVKSLASCDDPTDLVVYSITMNGATVDWTGGNATEWIIEYRKTLTEPEYTAVEGTVSTPSYTFTNFDPDTQYSVRVKAVCSPTETTDPSDELTFTTDPPLDAPHYLTVYNGTNTNEHVPFYCDYFYARYTKTQHVIPAADLAVMDGDTIKGIRYYSSRTTEYTTTSSIDFYLKEVDYTTPSTFVDKSSATVVYTGTVTIGSDGVTTILFDTPYIYEGGNLLVGAENKTMEGGYPGSIYFYGQNASYCSTVWNYSYTPQFTSVREEYFIPKSTFIYKINTTCPRPKNLTASDITVNSATLSWTPRGEETAWFVQYKKMDDDQWIDKGTVTSPTCALDNLDDYTDYQFRVKPDCTEGADWTGAATFKTLWTMVTIDEDHPYSTGFEGETRDWYFIDRGQTNAWARGNATQNGGSKSLYISDNDGIANHYNTTSPSTSYAIKPFHLGAGYHFVSFDWKAMGNSGSDFLRVALAPASTTLTAGTTPMSYYYYFSYSLPTGWMALDGGAQLYGNSTWQSQSLEFNVNAEGDYVVVLAWTNQEDYGYSEQPPAAIDNFNINYVSCPRPNTPTLTYAGADYAIINWTALGSETSWNMQYKQADANSWTDVAAPIDARPYTLSGLVSGTDYQVRIQSSCGSNWTEPLSFTTLCDPIDSFPFKEYFSSINTPGQLPDCWNNIDGTFTNENYKWSYTNQGHNGNGVRFTSYSNTSGQTNFLKTPIMNLPADKTMQLSFWYRNDNGIDFSVYISTDRGRTYNTALATSLPTTNGWTEIAIAIPDAYIGAENVVFVFKGTTTTNYRYLYLDDVTVEEVPTCPKPKDLMVNAITESTATLAWTAQGAEDTWEIVYSTDPDFDPNIFGTHVTVTENPFTVTGLRSGVTYYAYVRAKCSGEETSPWCNTSCSFYPIKELTVNNGSDTNPYVPSRRDVMKQAGGRSQFIIPAESLTELRNSRINKLTFYSNSSSLYFYGTYIIYIGETEQTSFASAPGWDDMTPVYTGTLSGSNNRLEITFDTPFDYVDGNLKIGVYQSVKGSNQTDNVNWYGIATSSYTAYHASQINLFSQRAQFLPKTTFSYAPFTSPFDLAVSNISASGATLSWHPMGNETHWDVFYTENPNYVPQANTHPQFINIGSNPYVMSGLEAGRTYYVYVRANEGDNGVSEWSLPCSFMLADLLTVYDGTIANNYVTNYVPVPGYYVNQPFQGEFIMPAEDLQAMANTEIRQITFYTTSPANIDWGELDYNLYLREVDFTETKAFDASGELSFDGVVSVVNNQMTLTLQRPYYYRGGNLLVSFRSDEAGAVNKITPYWAGTDTENTEGYFSSIIQYRDGSWFNIVSGGISFLPKTTFSYVIPEFVPQYCDMPTDLEVSDITTTSATISWTANNSSQEWEIEYYLNGEYVPVEGNITNPFTLQDLEPSHGYWVRVRAVCGQDLYSDWQGTWFSTECVPITLPYSYGFEDVPSGNIPVCWTRYCSGCEYYMKPEVLRGGGANTGYGALYFGGDVEEEYTQIAVLPQIPVDAEHPMSGNELVFYAYDYNGSSSSCEVGIMTDPNDPETFELIQALEIIDEYSFGQETINKYKVSFESYTGTGTYIAIRQVKTSGEDIGFLYIDDVTVRPITTCVEPTGLTVTAFTTTSATVQWTAEGTETTWHVQMKQYGDEWPETYQTLNTNSCTFDALVEGTMYKMRVRAACSDTETSDWTVPVCFTPVYNAPFFEDFGYYSSLWGWQDADVLMEDVLNGTPVRKNYTYNISSGINGTFANETTGMTYYVEGYNIMNASSDKDHQWSITPSIALGENYQLSFDLFLRYPEHATTGLDDNRFAVLVSENNGATWTVLGLWDNNATQGRAYYDIPAFPAEVNLDLSAYNNKTVLFAFYVESTVANDYGDNDIHYNQIYLDKVNVTKCIRPDQVVATNVTTTTAILDWTAHGETSWTLRYRIDGEEEWTTSTITEHPYTLTGLSWPYYYQVQLKAHNSFGESEWSDLVLFATECAPITLGPNETYHQSFNSGVGMGHMPACWSTSGTNNVWSVYNGYVKASLATQNTYGYLHTPEIVVTPGLTLTFQHSTELNTLSHVEVQVLTDYSTSIWWSDYSDISSGTTTISLNDYVGQTVTILFYYHATSNGDYGTASSFGIYDVSFYNRNTFTKQTNDGFWNETANWSAGVLPETTESVIVDGAAVIPNGYNAQVEVLYLTNNGSILIANGAQLKHNNWGVEAKVRKSIVPYTEEGGWYLISSPMKNAIEPSESLVSNNFDFYRFNQSVGLEWENYQQHFYLSPYFKLFNGKGNLYANGGNGTNPVVTIEMEGRLQPAGVDVEVPLVYDPSARLAGWNLVGNPFACNAYLTEPRDFYVLNADRNELTISESNVIAPMEGLFVQAADANDNAVTFTANPPQSKSARGALTLNVYEGSSVISGTEVVDRAKVRFDNGSALSKFSLNPNGTKLFITQGQQDYAVVSADASGEVPVSFKAERNGTYTISVNLENVEFDYLHLIDNMTGTDVDLLAQPKYTFTAKPTDDASRFRLVFSAKEVKTQKIIVE